MVPEGPSYVREGMPANCLRQRAMAGSGANTSMPGIVPYSASARVHAAAAAYFPLLENGSVGPATPAADQNNPTRPCASVGTDHSTGRFDSLGADARPREAQVVESALRRRDQLSVHFIIVSFARWARAGTD